MSWKEDITTLVDQNGRIVKLLQVLQGQVAINSKRIEAMRVIMDQSEKTRSRAADRMADRLVEMAMVNQGSSDMATSHRRSLEEVPEGADPWQDSPETQWPPPGHTEVSMP
jgi:hypothetical protein